jgi:hypothetical protein
MACYPPDIMYIHSKLGTVTTSGYACMCGPSQGEILFQIYSIGNHVYSGPRRVSTGPMGLQCNVHASAWLTLFHLTGIG